MSNYLRVATPDDAPQVLEIYAPFCVATPVSFETEPPTVEEMSAADREDARVFSVADRQDAGRVLGYAYASRHRERAAYRWSADVSVYVREDARGNGMGGSLYTSLFAILRLQGIL